MMWSRLEHISQRFGPHMRLPNQSVHVINIAHTFVIMFVVLAMNKSIPKLN